MKALFSEEYYRKYWNDFLVPVPGEDYINLESELEKAMKVYKESGISKEAILVVEKREAEKLAEKCNILVHKELDQLKRILSGKASFGMTTQLQESQKRGEFRRRFEFNCLQLSDFRKNHNL